MSKHEVIKTTCNICWIGCGVLVHVDNGKIVRIEGDAESPLNKGALCPKGMASLEYLHHPERLRQPLKRVGKRGEGKWLTVDWEEALGIIASSLAKFKEKYGPESVVFIRGGARGLQDDYFTRFVNVFGSPNITSMAHVCFIPRTNASMITYGFYAIPDLEYPPNSIIVWGENLSETMHHIYLRILGAVKNGTRLMVIDPIKNRIAESAHLWVNIKPGSDLAFALGMLNVIINESLYDKHFVEHYTLGFDELRDHIQNYAPEKVADITWTSPEIIKKAARLYATQKPACIQWGNGIDHSINNFQTARAICILRAITGNLGIPGGDIQWLSPPILERYSAEFSLYEKIPLEVRQRRIVGDDKLLPIVFYALPQSVIEAIIKGEPYPIRAAYIRGGNLLLSYPNAKKVYQALQKLEFLVVSDMFMTPTASLADVVLPVTTYLEFNSIISTPYSLAIATIQQKITRLNNCHSDYEILRDLGKKLELGEYFWDTEEECLDYILKPAGISFEEFKKIGVLWGAKQYRTYWHKGFQTPSKKVELYSNRLKEWGFDPLPVFYEPTGANLRTPDIYEEYPLIFTSWKSAPFRHSEGKQISTLRGIHPDPLCMIHPETAKKFGINDGDWISIETERGKIMQKATLETAIDPRIVGVDYGWWFPEKEQSTVFGWDESNVNVLIGDEPPYGREMGTPTLRGIKCKIYRSSASIIKE